MSELVIRFEVTEDGRPSTLVCFEYEGKRWCAYYPEPVEVIEEELQELGYPEQVIKFIINFLIRYDVGVDIPENEVLEDDEDDDWDDEEAWII